MRVRLDWLIIIYYENGRNGKRSQWSKLLFKQKSTAPRTHFRGATSAYTGRTQKNTPDPMINGIVKRRTRTIIRFEVYSTWVFFDTPNGHSQCDRGAVSPDDVCTWVNKLRSHRVAWRHRVDVFRSCRKQLLPNCVLYILHVERKTYHGCYYMIRYDNIVIINGNNIIFGLIWEYWRFFVNNI